jgi:hypothetical protein
MGDFDKLKSREVKRGKNTQNTLRVINLQEEVCVCRKDTPIFDQANTWDTAHEIYDYKESSLN